MEIIQQSEKLKNINLDKFESLQIYYLNLRRKNGQ